MSNNDRTTQSYHVVWEIDVDATSPSDAAKQALALVQEPGTHAVVFDIFSEDGESTRVDLLEDEEGGEGDF